MNKNEFIDVIASKGYTKKAAGVLIDDVITSICEVLANGDTLHLHGFGTFSVRDVAARKGIDFKTKEQIEVPGYKTPKFVPGNVLKRAVKEGILRE